MKKIVMFFVVFPIFLSVCAQQKREIKKIIGCYKMWDFDTYDTYYFLINETSILRYGFSNLYGNNELTVSIASYSYQNDTLKFCFNDIYPIGIDTVGYIWIYNAKRDCFWEPDSGDIFYKGFEKGLEKKLEAFGLSITMQDQIKKFKKRKKQKWFRETDYPEIID